MSAPAGQDGAVSLEAALLLPFIALVTLAVLQTVGVARDLLLVHDAARAGARSAATTLGQSPPVEAARDAADGRDVTVRIEPARRAAGDLVSVSVELSGQFGHLPYTVSARSVAEVEPGAAP